MKVRDRIRQWLRIATPANTRAAMPVRLPSGGRRVTTDEENQLASSGLKILSKLSDEEFWRAAMLDSRTLDRVPAWRLMELLIQLSPEISRARWDFLRMCNPGWECKVTRQGSEAEDAQAKALLDDFWALLKEYYGSADVAINRLFTCLFLRGEMVAELVLGADGRTMADLATPDPRAFDFTEKEDPVRGTIQQLGQWQAGRFVELNFSTVKHVALDPLPGNPRGVSLMSSALFAALFLVGLLHDLRRVIAQQGWPRHDIEIVLEELLASLPDEISSDPEAFKTAVEKAISDVAAVYSNLEPDDTYIHPSTIKVNRPVGTVDSSSLGAIDGVIAALERMCVRGLKTMPLMMGITDTVGEANANRQWEIYAAGIKALQHLVEGLLESLFEVGLRAAGRQAKVEFRFAELRAAEMLRDAQTEAVRIKNERDKYAAGWTSQDEASEAITGHPADQDEPRQAASLSPGGMQVGGNPDPGSNRQVIILTRSPESLALLLTAAEQPTNDQIDRSVDWWKENAPAPARDLIEAETLH
jgi:hypothetical protein